MQLRSFTLASSSLIAFFAIHLAAAQNSESAALSKNKFGYVRFWNMLPPANGTLDLRKLGGEPSEANLFAKAPSYRYSSYKELAPARYNLAVYKTGDNNTPLKTFSLDVKLNSYFTILVSPEGGVLNVQLINDTLDPKVPAATLIVRNFYPGLTVSVASGTQSIVNALAYGQSYTASDLPLKRTPLTLRSRLANGTPTESEAEADFVASKRGTLLIIPDTYGRFRPRVTIDGKNL
jgi:hypothetical protein